MREDELAQRRVEGKVRQRVRERQAEQRVQSIFQELESMYHDDPEPSLPSQSSSGSPQKRLEDAEMIQVFQVRLADAQKQADLLRIQLAEAEKTTEALREMLDKERARTRTI
jgi:hypothetical protein